MALTVSDTNVANELTVVSVQERSVRIFAVVYWIGGDGRAGVEPLKLYFFPITMKVLNDFLMPQRQMTLKGVHGYRYIMLESFIGHLRRMLSWQILSIDTTRL